MAQETAPPIRDLQVIGLGEALFDVFADRRVLGGAPLNVAVQAHQLLAPVGGRGMPVSRIGSDELGREILQELERRGISTEGIQVDSSAPTGRVLVELHGSEPEYDIVRDVAWDLLAFEAPLPEIARQSHAVCFGTLAQRSESARQAIGQFVEASEQAIRLFDVNLRQSFYDREVLDVSCRRATVVKLNEKELPTVAELTGLAENDPARDLLQRYELDAVVLTQGARGTALYHADGTARAEVPSIKRDEDADSVGAGDACTAGVLVGMLLDWAPERTVALANHMGAYVASRAGATPQLPDEILDLVRD